MKIYLFHLETGCFLGEDFTDESQTLGVAPAIPPDATIIPPPKCCAGEVPVYNLLRKVWEVRHVPRDTGLSAPDSDCASPGAPAIASGENP